MGTTSDTDEAQPGTAFIEAVQNHRMRKILILTLSFLALFAVDNAPVSAQHDGASPFLIGMLRGDGTVVPFAQYGNGGWWNPWPKPRQVAESIYPESPEAQEVLHHSLSDLSEPWFTQCGYVPTSWFYWSSAGTSTALTASKVIKVEAHSGTNWGLWTDLPKRASTDPLHDIIGVAVTARQEIEPFVKIEPGGAQGKDIDSFIKQIFDGVETSELERLRLERPAATGKVVTSLTVLFRSSSVVNGKHIYYVEAEKQYPRQSPSADLSCNDVSLFQGWISADEKGGMGLMADNFVFTNCDRKGPSTMIPVGLMKLKEQIFLFVREHGWEDESYTILELNSGLHRVLQTVGA
jgi:hypothetical protein